VKREGRIYPRILAYVITYVHQTCWGSIAQSSVSTSLIIMEVAASHSRIEEQVVQTNLKTEDDATLSLGLAYFVPATRRFPR
jgi:hypothetical protein